MFLHLIGAKPKTPKMKAFSDRYGSPMCGCDPLGQRAECYCPRGLWGGWLAFWAPARRVFALTVAAGLAFAAWVFTLAWILLN